MATIPVLSCEDVEHLLPLVADGTLATPEDDPALFDHLARCPRCQERLIQHDLVQLHLEAAMPAAATPSATVIHPAASWWRFAVAATLVVGSGIALLISHATDGQPPAVASAAQDHPVGMPPAVSAVIAVEPLPEATLPDLHIRALAVPTGMPPVYRIECGTTVAVFRVQPAGALPAPGLSVPVANRLH